MMKRPRGAFGRSDAVPRPSSSQVTVVAAGAMMAPSMSAAVRSNVTRARGSAVPVICLIEIETVTGEVMSFFQAKEKGLE